MNSFVLGVMAVSKMAEVLGVELTAETIAAQLGISDPDLGPATGGARLDALELRLITKREAPEGDSGAKGGDGDSVAATAGAPGSEPSEGGESAHGEKKEEMCAVCHDDLAVGQYELKFKACGHSFHPSCLNQWLDRRRTCPCCRAMLDQKGGKKGKLPVAGL
mmetsp:Transcript_31370/g.74547  ORF Transcript_31370/g.74547 Transcript_31370/m.74547 type:complete len:163 (+) Transcript_31370:149-637(+)